MVDLLSKEFAGHGVDATGETGPGEVRMVPPQYKPGGMHHVYEGEPDARQEEVVGVTIENAGPGHEPKVTVTTGQPSPTRFRPRYRALSDDEVKLHDAIKGWASEGERLINQCEAPAFADADAARYRALAITALEQTVMWAVKALTL